MKKNTPTKNKTSIKLSKFKQGRVLSNPTYSALILSTLAVTLMGCQSTATNTVNSKEKSLINLSAPSNPIHNQLLHKSVQQYQQQFPNSEGVDVDANAQSILLNAIKQHMATNHVSVTQIRQHDKPFIKEGSVDSLSDSALRELYALAMGYSKSNDRDYSEPYYEDYEEEDYEEYAQPPYRSETDYLEGDESLDSTNELSHLYLNYRDEKLGILPFAGYSIDKETGMSDEFAEKTYNVLEYTIERDECVLSYSYDLDELVGDNPNISSSDTEVKDLESVYKECVQSVTDDYSYVLKEYKGYQKKYVDISNDCKSRFDKNLSDILNANRSPKSISYDDYDSIYETYDLCHTEILTLNDLEPYNYIYEATPESELLYKSQIIDCTHEMNEQQNTAIAQGITYKNNPSKFNEIYGDVLQCKVAAEDIRYNYLSEPVGVYDETNEELATDELQFSHSEANEETNEIDDFFTMFKLTPAQIDANNFYIYQYLTINRVSEFDIANRQVNSVFSYDYVSPTSYHSFKIPVGLDFNNAKMTVDPSAIMPLMALISPENALLTEEMTSTTVSFNLPDEITSKIPPKVIFDSFVSALSYSMSELDSSYFTSMDIRNDKYAKDIGAHSAIKVNLDSQQTGKLLAVIVKHMANSLEAHVESEPEFYEDQYMILAGLEKWQETNKRYQTEDAGKILQLIEAIGPFSFNKVNYYYLDGQGKLLGNQVQTSIGGDFLGATSTVMSQTRYDNGDFKSNPMNSLFIESFGQPFQHESPMSIDGNKLIEKAKNRSDNLNKARSARYTYAYNDDYDIDNYDEEDCGCMDETEATVEDIYEDYPNEVDAVDTIQLENDYDEVVEVVEAVEDIEVVGYEDDDDYEPVIKIISYGNVEDE